MNHIMKHLSSILMGTLLLLASCNPITDDETYALADISAEQLEITATPVVVNGMNGNQIVVENHSAVLSEWTLPQLFAVDEVSQSAYDTLYASRIGTNEVKFRGFNPSTGNYMERTLPVQVDAINVVPAELSTRLCIGQEGGATGFGTELDFDKIEVIVEKDANGLNGNRVTLRNPNPVLTDWNFAGETSDKNVATLYVFNLGETPLSATFTLADGSVIEHTFDPIDVQTYTYKPDFLVNLTGESGERTWTWVAPPVPMYGLGGYGSDTTPSWFAFDSATLGMLAGALSRGEELTGTMTFKITGELELSSGRKGTWSFNLDEGVDGWSIGKLYTQDVSVLYGYTFSSVSYSPGAEAYAYDIVVSQDGSLTLAVQDPGNPGAATFWSFQAVD